MSLFTLTEPHSLAISTIRGYRAMLSSSLPGGHLLTESEELKHLIKWMQRQRPVTKKLCPQWSLALVLNFLTGPPFEPIMHASLLNLTLKTVFLVKLASGRRRSELHALSFSDGCCTFSRNLSKVTLITQPGFIGKNQDPSKAPPLIVIPGLVDVASKEIPDYTLCPVRALKAYEERTLSPTIRCGLSRMFIHPSNRGLDIKPEQISAWIVSLVKMAYEQSSSLTQSLSRVSGHDIRKFSASWAVFNSVPFEEVMQAAFWASDSVFTKHYLTSMSSQAAGLFALGPLVASQTVIAPPRTVAGGATRGSVHRPVPLVPPRK